jgi:hypothetical protein
VSCSTAIKTRSVQQQQATNKLLCGTEKWNTVIYIGRC